MLKENKNSNKLYIIGNGFDLHHGLETSYHHFANYLKENDTQLYDLLISYFYFSNEDEDFWWRFEENLANFDVDQMLDDYRDYLPDIISEEFRERDLHVFPDIMRNMLESLTTGLVASFANFIRTVQTPIIAKQRMLDLDKDSLFFTFNYTYLLEDLYGIDPINILHIHNGAESRYREIILGHGIDPDNFKEEEEFPPDGLNEKELKQWYEQQAGNWDYSYDSGKESILSYFTASYKPTKEIIVENHTFFESLSGIREVNILGHSLANVDLPYFEEIARNVNVNAKWTVSFYNPSEIENHNQQLIKLGIKESKIELVKLKDLQVSSKLQLKMNFKKNKGTHINHFFNSESLFL